MSDLILNLLMIQVIVCFIIDLSGFINSVESGLSRWLKYRVSIPRPFSCSLCSGFWLGLVYILFTGWFNLTGIVTVSLISFFSRNITGILRWIQEMLIKLEDLLYRIIR